VFFEGSEKKLEVVVGSGMGPLRELDENYWESIVGVAEASILSKISNSFCDAFLLSESSLFVWDDRFTMITCGQTVLANAAIKFLEDQSENAVLSLIYQRKNEFYPRLQRSDFFKDIEQLSSKIDGKAYRFGEPDGHHLYLFHMNKEFQPASTDQTLEILMYNIKGSLREAFVDPQIDTKQIRKLTSLDQLFEGFEINDHAFSPCGYSMNALMDEKYYTVHVTPEEEGAYVSFETNVNAQEQVDSLLNRLTEVFQPQSFDIVSFGRKDGVEIESPKFVRKNFVKEKLRCGYQVYFSHFYEPRNQSGRAVELFSAASREIDQ